jgi:hypothetical protein
MGRRVIICSAVWAALAGFAVEPMQAQDRRSTGAARIRPVHVDQLAAREARPLLLRHDLVTASTPRRLPGARPVVQHQTETSEAAPNGERKSVTFFRFNSEVGEIAVQPVAGQTKGLQLSVGF